MDYKHTDQEILSIVSKFLQKMEDSHYRKPAREEIIRSAVKKYWRMRLQEVIGVRDMNRTREDMNKEGRFKQMRTQTQFKSRRRGSPRDSGVVGEEQELQFLDKIEEQRWKTGSEMEGKRYKNKGRNRGRKQ